MLLVLLVVVIGRGKRYRRAVDELGSIVGDVGRAVDIDGTRLVGEVEVAVLGVDRSADLAGQFEEGGLIGGGDELGDRLGGGVAVVDLLLLVLGLAVQGIEITGIGTALDR